MLVGSRCGDAGPRGRGVPAILTIGGGKAPGIFVQPPLYPPLWSGLRMRQLTAAYPAPPAPPPFQVLGRALDETSDDVPRALAAYTRMRSSDAEALVKMSQG